MTEKPKNTTSKTTTILLLISKENLKVPRLKKFPQWTNGGVSPQ